MHPRAAKVQRARSTKPSEALNLNNNFEKKMYYYNIIITESSFYYFIPFQEGNSREEQVSLQKFGKFIFVFFVQSVVFYGMKLFFCITNSQTLRNL